MTDAPIDTLQDPREMELRLESRHRRFRVVELYIWMLVALVCLARVILASLSGEYPIMIFREYYGDLLLGFFVVMFPILFQLVFGNLPLEALRRRRFAYASPLPYEPAIVRARTRDIAGAAPPSLAEKSSDSGSAIDASESVGTGQNAATSTAAESLVLALAQSSKKLADGIYSRSGVYLLVGVMVAFSGLGFFYSQTTGSFSTNDVTGLLVSLAPKFGILFFIEFVAFFFLKQYRTSMDEFRYYEAIKRHREEILVLLKAGNEQQRPLDTFEMVKLGQFFSVAGRLQKEESTELLEARKLEKNETAVLEKVIDAIAQARK
jgi:hypothetical protein